jgi:transposase
VREAWRVGAAAALAHGLNANMVHKWRRQGAAKPLLPVTTFVPATVGVAPPQPAVIRIELRRDATAVNVAWPLAGAAECAVWLRELLK